MLPFEAYMAKLITAESCRCRQPSRLPLCHADSLRVSALQACTALDVDVIAFDLARRLPFRLRPAALAAAVRRGVALELCYAPALHDEAARRNLFGNAAGAWFICTLLGPACMKPGQWAGGGCMLPRMLSSGRL